jgi:hypothetical protein
MDYRHDEPPYLHSPGLIKKEKAHMKDKRTTTASTKKMSKERRKIESRSARKKQPSVRRWT